jgi:zinc protease
MSRTESLATLALVGMLASCGGPAASLGPTHADLPNYAPGTDDDAARAAGPRRERPPEGSEARPAPFPAAKTHTLKNGLSVAVLEAHTLPIVHLRVVVRAGSGYAPKQPGLAQLTAEMLKDGGTRSFASADLLRKVEGFGGDVWVDVDEDQTTLGLRATKAHFSEALAILGEMTQAPRFDEGERAKLKARTSDEAEDALRGNGHFVAMYATFHQLYPEGSPYSVHGALPRDVAKLTSAAVRDFHRRFFVPTNTTVIVAGDVTADVATAAVDKVFAGFAGGPAPKVDFPAPTLPAKRKVIVAHRAKSTQSDVFVIGLAPPRSSPDWASVSLCDQIFGGGSDGRIYADVREQRSLAYAVGSDIITLTHGPQPFYAYAGTKTDKTAETVLALLENEEKLAASGVTDEEAVSSRRYLGDVFALRMDTVGKLANLTANLVGAGLPYDYWDTYRTALRATTAATASRAATTLYHPDTALIVVAGDADVIASKLTRFGEVTVVDPEHQFASIRTLASEPK